MSSSLSLMLLSAKPSFHFRSHRLHLRPIRVTGNENGIRRIRSFRENHLSTEQNKLPRWENMLEKAASLYPAYVTVGAVVAWYKPFAFSWAVERAPASYSLAVGFIMFAMGMTLELAELFNFMMQRPLSVTLIAKGDVPLSIVMTTCTTLGAVVLTPILVKVLAGTFVPVDALKLSISTLQLVVAPILLGSFIQRKFPSVVKSVLPFAPLSAILVTSLLTCSIVSENVHFLKTTMVGGAMASNLSLVRRVQEVLFGELGMIILSVALLHSAGFFVGYLSAAVAGFEESQRRAISIEVGMQNSSLGLVLASTHFTSPMVALPSAISAVLMNILGSSLGFIWRQIDLPDSYDC